MCSNVEQWMMTEPIRIRQEEGLNLQVPMSSATVHIATSFAGETCGPQPGTEGQPLRTDLYNVRFEVSYNFWFL
jgi:hypothetical protein